MHNKRKYGNKKVLSDDGQMFDSKREKARYDELTLLQSAGEISNLRRQVKYTLIPSQYNDGKCVERPVTYKADFVYEQNGETIVEDVKGMRTDKYIIKRKLMLYIHGIRIKEV